MCYQIHKVRDLSVISITETQSLVIACDSNASIGEKPADYYKNSYDEVAVSALKVPMMEVIATGASPLVVINNLCVEMEQTGRHIITIMRQELDRHGYDERLQITGSTEDNMPTVQTGIGVTVVGMLDAENNHIGQTRKDDLIICVGIPRSGIKEHYSEFQPDIANIGTVRQLVGASFVHEILPIGSKGAAYEAGQLCQTAGLVFEAVDSPVDTATSAGSSTAVLCSIDPRDYSKLDRVTNCPYHVIGKALVETKLKEITK